MESLNAFYIFVAVTLGVKRSGEVAVFDYVFKFASHGGFGVIADSQSCAFEHWYVVGAVTDCHTIIGVDDEVFAILVEEFDF